MPQKIGMVFIQRQAKQVQVQAQQVQVQAKQVQVQAKQVQVQAQQVQLQAQQAQVQVQARPTYAKMGIFQPHSIIHTPPGSCGACGH
jgi:hypothetical protein